MKAGGGEGDDYERVEGGVGGGGTREGREWGKERGGGRCCVGRRKRVSGEGGKCKK
jgi:hypothetical protein